MKAGEEIYKALTELEKKLWNREDYSEEDIPLFSNAMDFITANKEAFEEFFEPTPEDCWDQPAPEDVADMSYAM